MTRGPIVVIVLALSLLGQQALAYSMPLEVGPQQAYSLSAGAGHAGHGRQTVLPDHSMPSQPAPPDFCQPGGMAHCACASVLAAAPAVPAFSVIPAIRSVAAHCSRAPLAGFSSSVLRPPILLRS